MKKLGGGVALTILALFMLLGFVSGGTGGTTGAARGLTFLILAILPGSGGGRLIYLYLRARRGSRDRGERLRRRTQEAEVLRFARDRGGKLTIADVIADTGLDADTAEEILVSLVTLNLANYDLAGSGELIYTFYGLGRAEDELSRTGGQDAQQGTQAKLSGMRRRCDAESDAIERGRCRLGLLPEVWRHVV